VVYEGLYAVGKHKGSTYNQGMGEGAMKFFVAIFLFVSCGGANPIQPGPPVPELEAERVCMSSCLNLAKLQCPGYEGSPGADEEFGTEDDVPCSKVCVDLAKDDPASIPYHNCMSGVGSCEAAEACFDE
jgi:hypothetical protein